MNTEELCSFVEILIDAQRPASGMYVLYVVNKQIYCDRDRPRTSDYEIICYLNSEYINSGFPRLLWWAVCSRLARLKKKGIIL